MTLSGNILRIIIGLVSVTSLMARFNSTEVTERSCHPRLYYQSVDKDLVYQDGEQEIFMTCRDVITVMACFGVCDTYEVSTFDIPSR